MMLGTLGLNAQGSFAPAVGNPGTTAIHKDSSIIINWASSCNVTRGLMNISNSSMGNVTSGVSSNGTGIADGAIVSIGDAGEAVLSFSTPISNGTGPDFAVFENAFDDFFLELAFVEVSSDGTNYTRFPAISETQDTIQVGGFGTVDATMLYNFAGKYRAQYGTPFDLQELDGTVGLNINQITHIKLIDVIGNINDQYASYDSQGNKVNDPYPTPFATGGFDLDAVGVINQFVGVEEFEQNQITFYPNPATNQLNIKTNNYTELKIYSLYGKLVKQTSCNGTISLDVSNFDKGVYFIQSNNGTLSEKLIIK